MNIIPFLLTNKKILGGLALILVLTSWTLWTRSDAFKKGENSVRLEIAMEYARQRATTERIALEARERANETGMEIAKLEKLRDEIIEVTQISSCNKIPDGLKQKLQNIR